MTRFAYSPTGTFRLMAILLLILIANSIPAPRPCFAADEDHGFYITFYLLPARLWQGGEGPSPEALEKALSDALLDGRVFFYPQGDYQPRVVLEANVPGKVPVGRWNWIAEAPGYVSVVASSVQVTEELAEGRRIDKNFILPVVPACHVTLDEDANWSAVGRLDFVSFGHNAVYPLVPENRKDLWIPAGSNLVYSVDSRGLGGIVDLGVCKHFAEITIKPPSPPPADRQDFMINVGLDDQIERSVIDWGALSARVQQAGPKPTELPIPPLGQLWAGEQWSFFFLGVPADRDWDVVVDHPKLRTITHPVESLGGSVRELPRQVLRQRLSVTLTVDYQPKRDHRQEELLVFSCDQPQRSVRMPRVNPCATMVHQVALRPGAVDYLMPDLDVGRYAIHAAIDGEFLYGLGSNVSLAIDPGDEFPPELPVIPIHEMEIFGQILVDGDPVVGEVRIVPTSVRGSRDVAPGESIRSFPTDDELFYHMYFFGRLPFFVDFPPADDSEFSRRGLFPGTEVIEVCSADRFCRTYNFHSRLRGEGRLDFEIDVGRKIIVLVTDASDGEPVADAFVFVSQGTDARALHFNDGEVEWKEPDGMESLVLKTDAMGGIPLRIPAKLERPMRATKSGYVDFTGFPPEDSNVFRIALEKEPEKPEGTGTTVVFRDDEAPIPNGYFLIVRDDGMRALGCSATTDMRGKIWFEAGCLDAGQAVFFHPLATITIFDAPALATMAEVEIDRGPARPLVLRVVDAERQPVPNMGVILRFPSVTLTPQDLIFAAVKSGHFFRMTDGRGELLLRGIDPGAPQVVEIVPAHQGFSGSVRVTEARDGVLELMVE